MKTTSRILLFLLSLTAGAAICAQEPSVPLTNGVIISVADQKLALVQDGGVIEKYRISTSKFGIGDSFYSYKTPTGRLRVCEKIGDSLDPGTVIRNRASTGEILRVNAPGRDPIVTRILWLDGLESQNRNAKARGIYIHGTPEERTLGEPKSWGCIRMRSSDVIKLFEQVPVGTEVAIIPGHLPHMERYRPPEPVLYAVNTPPAQPARIENPPTAASAVARETKKIEPAVTPLPAHTAIAVEAAIEKPVPTNEKVSRAFKGSILMAGLPNAPSLGPTSHVAAVPPGSAILSSGEKSTANP